MMQPGDFGFGSPLRGSLDAAAGAPASPRPSGRTIPARTRSAIDRIRGFFTRKASAATATPASADLASMLSGFSMEVMPRTLARCTDFEARVPAGTRVYVAHIDGTDIGDMVAAAARISGAGLAAMPHVPARSLTDRAMLEDWLKRYRDAGAKEALVLAGGVDQPRGAFHSSMQLLETGLFDKHGFTRLHVAGHPEGNRDIDTDGSDENLMQALRWKQAFRERTNADMAIVTQFTFDLAPVTAWAERLTREGVDLPIHLGIAGPAKLQTMIKFALSCGVGPSVRVLQRRAADITNLLLPYEPTEMLHDLAVHKRQNPDSLVRQVHFFPFGGIAETLDYARTQAAPGRA